MSTVHLRGVRQADGRHRALNTRYHYQRRHPFRQSRRRKSVHTEGPANKPLLCSIRSALRRRLRWLRRTIASRHLSSALCLASLSTLPIASALPQSDPESKFFSLLNSTELADVAKKSGLPEATVQNCSICGTWAADVVQSKCGRYPDDFEFESDCFCAGDGPKKTTELSPMRCGLGPGEDVWVFEPGGAGGRVE
ncbi:hypothetical protein FA13DRAFT_1088338 [Coprinellus micaceus]|uniref:Uncharacterized protein n=1 Tax=Coprinellus micaceus TaxID=71717 RepID=A0A4Y7TRN6_COPMI|nr:hypothetical protein FA13DRAFT_1088338 [Coprinellus micaceus]